MAQNDCEFNKYREDFHYSFVEYQGSNIVHWSFSEEDVWNQIKVSGISKKIFLIADTDATKEKPHSAKSNRLKLLQSHLGENFLQIDGREIENTLKENILIETVLTIEDSQNIDYKNIKAPNYKFKKLGAYIEKNFKGLEKQFSSSSGTIKNKVEFCKVAIRKITSVEDLSEEGKKLAEEIFKFISRSNK